MLGSQNSCIALLLTFATLVDAKLLSHYNCSAELPASRIGEVVVIRKSFEKLATRYENTDEEVVVPFGWKTPRIFFYSDMSVQALLLAESDMASIRLTMGKFKKDIVLEDVDVPAGQAQLLGSYWFIGKDYGTNMADLAERLAADVTTTPAPPSTTTVHGATVKPKATVPPNPIFPIDCEGNLTCRNFFGPVPHLAKDKLYDHCFNGTYYCTYTEGRLLLHDRPVIFENLLMVVFNAGFYGEAYFTVHVVDKIDEKCYTMPNADKFSIRFPTTFNGGYEMGLPVVLLVTLIFQTAFDLL